MTKLEMLQKVDYHGTIWFDNGKAHIGSHDCSLHDQFLANELIAQVYLFPTKHKNVWTLSNKGWHELWKFQKEAVQ